jgi:hypothetical protein
VVRIWGSYILQQVAHVILLLLLPALQSLVNLSLFQNCPPIFSVLLLVPIYAFDFYTSSTDSGHPNLGLPTRWVPSGLSGVSFLQESISCVLKSFPSHLSLPTCNTWTTSSSSQSVYNTLLYLVLHISLSLIGP